MTEKNEALRLADALDYGVYDAQMARVMDKAAAELRRLHAQRDALLDALKEAVDVCGWPNVAFFHKALAAIKQAEGENT